MDKQAAIQIHEESEGVLRFVDEAGTSHTYQPHARLIFFTVDSLSISELFGRSWSPSAPDILPKLVASRKVIKGFATLGDRGISIIGNPSNWATRVALSISSRTAEEQMKAVQACSENSQNVALHLSDANLGYLEDGAREEHWSLNLQVAERTLDVLADAVQYNRVHSLQISVSLENVYNDGDLGSLYNDEPVYLFLRPSIRSGDVQFPELAYGQVGTWTLKFVGTAVLSDPFAQQLPPTSDMKHAEEPRGPSDVDRTLSALERLTTGVGALRTSVNRAGWILAAALIISTLMK